MATKPMIGPKQAPEMEMWPRMASMITHVVSPVAAAAWVLISASAAKPLE